MSKVVHRKPVWGWGVALLSTLLLSPMAGTAALCALAHASNLAGASAVLPAGVAAEAPRRPNQEDALRAARGDRPLALRLDTQPDSIAIVFPACTIVLVADDAPLAHAPAAPDRLCGRPRTATTPRAPPFVSLSV